jgi:hypothetical protein
MFENALKAKKSKFFFFFKKRNSWGSHPFEVEGVACEPPPRRHP